MSDSGSTPGVVVGVDGSAHSREAAEWAAREAERLHQPLTVCTVIVTIAPEFHLEPQVTDAEWRRGNEIVEIAATQIAAAHRDVAVRRLVTSGQPGEELIRVAERATTLVVGARGHGGFGALLLGSASDYALTHASCPVVVVRGESWREATPIVVGVDEKGSPAATQYAFEMASSLGAPLIAVRAFALPAPLPKVGFDADEQMRIHSHRYKGELFAALAAMMEKHPDVTVHQWSEAGSPGARLVEASVQARLLVVGAHAHSEVAAVLLGSVSRQAVHHAHCPVAVVRS
jgi:nucleotide-binding universal stress UspA family protein